MFGEKIVVFWISIRDHSPTWSFDNTIRLEKTHLMVEGVKTAITTGMSVTAEIKVGKRRIIEFFIYPLIKYLDEGMSVRWKGFMEGLSLMSFEAGYAIGIKCRFISQWFKIESYVPDKKRLLYEVLRNRQTFLPAFWCKSRALWSLILNRYSDATFLKVDQISKLK